MAKDLYLRAERSYVEPESECSPDEVDPIARSDVDRGVRGVVSPVDKHGAGLVFEEQQVFMVTAASCRNVKSGCVVGFVDDISRQIIGVCDDKPESARRSDKKNCEEEKLAEGAMCHLFSLFYHICLA